MTQLTLRALAPLAVLGLLVTLPGCTVVEEVFGGDHQEAAATQPLEPAAPPAATVTPAHVMTGDAQNVSPMTQGIPPLVVIKFDKTDVAYEKPLYDAMNATLKTDPSAMFYVVAIVPPQSTAEGLTRAQGEASANVERVVKAMTEMGLPASRISIASTTNPIAKVSEVRVFVR